VLVLLGFGALELAPVDLQNSLLFSINLVTAAIAGVAVIYGLAVFRFIAKHKRMIAGYITYILLFAEIASLVVTTGGFESQYLLLWAIVIFFAGMFGWPTLLLSWVITNGYYVLTITGYINNEVDPVRSLLYMIAVELPFLVSFFIWYGQTPSASTGTTSGPLSDEDIQPHMLINAVAEGVVVVDKDGRVQVFNPAAQTLSGWPEDEAKGLDYHSVLILVDKQGNQLLPNDDPIHQVFQKGKPVVNNDVILSTRHNKHAELTIVASPITNKNGGIAAVVAVFRDVSKERSEERQRAEFISTASHEMRTPVAAIEGYLALATNDNVAKIDSKAREYLEKAHMATEHLGKLFQDLLTAAKSEDGRLSYNPRVIDFGAFLDQLVEDIRFAAEKKGLILEYESGNTPAGDAGNAKVRPVYYSNIDTERMQEVITNLFDNAIKYTAEGKITIGLGGDTDNVVVTVSDTGPGIAQEDIPHLFQKFYRVDNSTTRQIGGTGLGLYISRRVVEMSGGKIWVDSEVGKGSNFHISLPRLSPDKASIMMKEEAAKVTPLSNVASTASTQ